MFNKAEHQTCSVDKQLEDPEELTNEIRNNFLNHCIKIVTKEKLTDITHVSIFDSEAVILIQCSFVSLFYHNRKLSSCNLFVF